MVKSVEETECGSGFDRPIGMASDDERFVYITDRNRVYEMDTLGRSYPVRAIAGTAPKYGSCSDSDLELNLEAIVNTLKPCGIAYTTAKDGKSTLYITEYHGGKVDTCTKGEDDQWTVATVAKGLDRPFGIEVKDGNVYVTETGANKCIKIIKPDGTIEPITDITTPGNGDPSRDDGTPGKVVDPRFLAVKGGKVYFADGRVIREITQNDNGNVPGSISSLAGASNEVVARAAATESTVVEDQDFRFGLSTEQIMLTMRQRGVNFAENSSNRDPYTRSLNALEKTIDSTHAIRQIGRGMTVWVSGLYTQGQLDSMFGNPAMKNKHYAIMVGTHYKDAATQQIFGVAVNVGFGNSIANTDKDLRTDNKAAQLTFYYNKKLDEEGHWKFSWHNTLMRSMDRHQRPFVDTTTGSILIAIGNGITYEFSSSAEVSYKHEFSKDNFIKPFTAFNYVYNKEMAYKEGNVGRFNRSNASASTDQVGLQFGFKSSIGHKLSEAKTLVVMPKISYTLFTKMGHTVQPSTNINSGQTAIGQSGTPGRHLLSATMAVGVVDYETNMTTRFAYTGNLQKHKRSHEIMLDWGMKF